MKLLIPNSFLVHHFLVRETEELLIQFRASNESAHTHLLNAAMQKYPAFWVAALIVAAERDDKPVQFLREFADNNTPRDENGNKKESWYEAKVALAILEASC
jgi:hypothetical protein